jgi:hypothetical protein
MIAIRHLLGDWNWDLRYRDGENNATITVNPQKVGEVFLHDAQSFVRPHYYIPA